MAKQTLQHRGCGLSGGIRPAATARAPNALGGAWTFGIFAALSVLAFAFVYALAPETKGRQLEDIRGYWYNGGRWPEEAQGATVGATEQGRP